MQLCLANFKDFGPSTKYRNGRGVPKAARCRNRGPADARRPAASPLTTTASLEAKAAATSSSAATMEIRPLSHPAAPETRKQPCQMMIRSNPGRPSRIGRTPGSNRWTANEIPSTPCAAAAAGRRPLLREPSRSVQTTTSWWLAGLGATETTTRASRGL